MSKEIVLQTKNSVMWNIHENKIFLSSKLKLVSTITYVTTIQNNKQWQNCYARDAQITLDITNILLIQMALHNNAGDGIMLIQLK